MSCHKAYIYPNTYLDQSIAETKSSHSRESGNQRVNSVRGDVHVDARKHNEREQEHARLVDQVDDEHGIRHGLLSSSVLVHFLSHRLPTSHHPNQFQLSQQHTTKLLSSKLHVGDGQQDGTHEGSHDEHRIVLALIRVSLHLPTS